MPPPSVGPVDRPVAPADVSFADALESKIWRRIALANLVGVVPINIYFVLASEHFRMRIDLSYGYALVPLAVYAPAYLWSRWRARINFRAMAGWVLEGGEPSSVERLLTIDHPRKLASLSLACWIWALVCAMAVGLTVFESLGFAYVGVGITILISAMIACSLCYLVAEDAMRPLFSRVLIAPITQPASVGVLPRLAATWIVGSASYFVAIVLLVVVFPNQDTLAYVVGACVVALVVGPYVTAVSSRSVTRPLENVRNALAKVEQGDLDVAVDVDDAGEVGQVQAGFNRMVAGLRDRDRLKLLFDRHVGADVARRAFESSELSGEELDATVMFVDVLSSTTLAAERPPQAVVAMLNGLFGAVVEVVGRAGGLVNQFQGDGALCVFGAPQAVPDHAARGLRAAVALRARIEELGMVYPGFDAAIGLSSGRVVGGDVGSEQRYEYTVIGDAANEAARLTDEAKRHPGRVLVSKQTLDSADARIGDWEMAGELSLRGRPGVTEAYAPA